MKIYQAFKFSVLQASTLIDGLQCMLNLQASQFLV